MLALVSAAPVAQFSLADTATSTPQGAKVETGDASSGTEVNNTINSNIVDLTSGESTDNSTTTADVASSTPELVSEASTTATSTPASDVDVDTATTTPEVLNEDNNEASTTVGVLNTEDQENGSTTLSIDNENFATSTTAATSTAETGENEAETDEGTASVASGNAYAFADIANTVNSNFVGSNGVFQLLNIFGNIFGELSLTLEDGAECTFLCFLTELFVSNYNDGYVENNIAVSADTGTNTATSTEGDATITTGNAFAAANVINMVNTNVIGSDYLAFIMNAFGSWEGDLVLPPGSFWEGNASSSPCCNNGISDGSFGILNSNKADIDNAIDTDATSGENSADGGETSTVFTGDAIAASNVMTVANTNILGNNLLLIYVRTLGNWSGHVFSLPSGVNIIGMGDGFIIDGFSSQLGGSLLGSPSGISSTTISNKNNARIINNVTATASTGGNKATAGGNASITTGNALAAANVVNIANTNIIGKNWLLAIVNVFGDWVGDLAFGRPDLWVGASAEGPSPLSDGASPRFTVTYRNNGNAPATESEISFDFGSNLSVTDTGGGTVNGSVITWDAGTINPGEFGSFSFAAEVHGSPTGDSQGIVLAMADMFEDDGNIVNNIDELILRFYNQPPEGFLGYSQVYARLEIAKERLGADLIYPGDEVAYRITIENKGAGHAYNVLVEDEMKDDETAKVISQQAWDLSTVYPGEKVIIEYTVQFASSTPAGIYTNYALAKWYDEVGNYVDHSGHSSAFVEVGIATTTPVGGTSNGSGGTLATTSPNEIATSEGGIGGNGDTGTSTEPAALIVEENSTSKASDKVVKLGGHEADVLANARPVYISDARPLTSNIRNEINNARRNRWDPRNLMANISFAGINYAILWSVLAGIVIYLISRKREQA